jgi:hypothetical protein
MHWLLRILVAVAHGRFLLCRELNLVDLLHTPGRVGGSVPDPQYPYTFLGLPNPLVRGPDPNPFIIKQNSEENLISTVLLLLYDFLSVKNDVNVPSKCKKPQT